MPAAPINGRFGRRELIRALVACGGAAAVFAAATGRLVPGMAVAAALAVVLLAAAALRWTGTAVCSTLVVICCVPVYWGRPVLGLTIVAVPATVAAVVLLPVAATQVSRFRPQALDVAFIAYVSFLALAAALNVSHAASASVGILWRSLIPYVVWRLVALKWLNWMSVLRTLVVAGTVLAGLAIQERVTGRNPFFSWVRPDYQAGDWAHSLSRNGVVRSEASFGEPISFGLFLGVCVVAAITLIVLSRHVLEQVLAAGCAVAMTVAIIDTQSRVALAAVLVAGAIQLFRLLSGRRAGRVIALLIATGAAVVISPLGAHVQQDATSGSGTSREALSAQYRLTVFDVLTAPSNYSLLGKPDKDATSVSALARQQTGLDNQYAHVLITGGALAFVSFLGLALALLFGVIRTRERDPAGRAISSSLAVVAVALLVVALLTQFGDLFGIFVAMAAAGRQREREVRA
jgi:O-antigen ligase